jgi:hypothetical protein
MLDPVRQTILKLLCKGHTEHIGEAAAALMKADMIARREFRDGWSDVFEANGIASSSELEHLRQENARLRARLAEAEFKAAAPAYRHTGSDAEKMQMILNHPEFVSEWEAEFIVSLETQTRALSAKQAAVLDRIAHKVRLHSDMRRHRRTGRR